MIRAIGLLNGDDIDLNSVSSWIGAATCIYAADGATDTCLALGYRPVVVGDLDSVKSKTSGLRVERIVDQDFTDCQKLLQVAEADGVEDLVIAGLEGNRPDHSLATLSALVGSKIQIRTLYRLGIGLILREGRGVSLSLGKGATFSIIPLPQATLSVSGSMWDIESGDLTLGDRVSLSNQSTGNTAISIHRGAALLYVPQRVAPWEFPWRQTETPSG